MRIPLGLDFPTDWGRREPALTVRRIIHGTLLVPFVRYLSTLEVRGTENLVTDGTMIFAANHVSHLDTPLVLSALPPDVRRHLLVAGAMDTFFMNASKAIYTVLAEGLASNGFVVVATNHPPDSLIAVYPDGRELKFKPYWPVEADRRSQGIAIGKFADEVLVCLLYTSPSPRD